MTQNQLTDILKDLLKNKGWHDLQVNQMLHHASIEIRAVRYIDPKNPYLSKYIMQVQKIDHMFWKRASQTEIIKHIYESFKDYLYADYPKEYRDLLTMGLGYKHHLTN